MLSSPRLTEEEQTPEPSTLICASALCKHSAHTDTTRTHHASLTLPQDRMLEGKISFAAQIQVVQVRRCSLMPRLSLQLR
jgi:hypothetical protein